MWHPVKVNSPYSVAHYYDDGCRSSGWNYVWALERRWRRLAGGDGSCRDIQIDITCTVHLEAQLQLACMSNQCILTGRWCWYRGACAVRVAGRAATKG